ncbi:HPr-rel-A system PqqD family peptide chaperone [Noviherbaspirillum humi]|nr:HPr-rel-A system PqqD family peptide chaperone [Noviherbaspirillum humi]
MKWRLAADRSVHMRVWGDEAVVYHEATGDTHMLGPAATQLLLALQQLDPMALDDLVECVSLPYRESVEVILAQLCSLELVEALPC